MENIYLRELKKIFRLKITYIIILILLLFLFLPLFFLYDKVKFDPATFLNNYYSIIITSFLISLFIQLANIIWKLSTKRFKILKTLTKVNEMYSSLEYNLKNKNFLQIPSIIHNLNLAITNFEETSITDEKINIYIKNPTRKEANEYLFSKLNKVLGQKKISEREEKVVLEKISILIEYNEKIIGLL